MTGLIVGVGVGVGVLGLMLGFIFGFGVPGRPTGSSENSHVLESLPPTFVAFIKGLMRLFPSPIFIVNENDKVPLFKTGFTFGIIFPFALKVTSFTLPIFVT